MSTAIQGKHFIAGHWQAGSNLFESRNPSQWDETVGLFPCANSTEVETALLSAQETFPIWRRTSRIHRAELFLQLAKQIELRLDEIAHLMARECGKNILECRAEVIEGLHMVQYVFGTARMSHGDVLASELPEKDAFVRRKPWGIAAVITPWNFPFAVPLWMLGPSLLEGNVAIFKPSEDSPAVGQLIVELFQQAGFPQGTIQLLHGDGTVGQQLVEDARTNVVLFTGSFEVGQKIQLESASHFNRIVAAEMGSKSAVIVCEDARLDLAVRAAILSSFKTTGQRCVSASRILVHESRIEKFIKDFCEMADRVQFGDALNQRCFAGPLIHHGAVEKVLQYNELAKKEGVTVHRDGSTFQPAGNKGCFLQPFIYQTEAKPGLRCIREEVFGPHVAVIPFRNDEHAAQIYNATDYGLSMAVITENYRKMRFFREECDFGMGYVNLPCIGAEVHLPFGGVKKSGNGHPSAAGLIETVTHKISWTVNHGEEIRMAQGLTANITEN
ncbi:MAG: aldehyde dehydrogenase family protein [Zavarzinella sp.]